LRDLLASTFPGPERVIDAGGVRPSDLITTAAGLTVEVMNPDAEGVAPDRRAPPRRAGRSGPRGVQTPAGRRIVR
jgi:hypothetical protein